MKIYNQSALVSLVKGSALFVDTNFLILWITHEIVLAPFLQLLENNCDLITIPSIAFEFSRTDTIEGYNNRAAFLNKHVVSYPIEKHISEFRDLVYILQKVNGKMSYSDFLLHCCLYKFKNRSFLLTENHRDFSTQILNRNEVLTIDNDDKEVRNVGMYSFSEDKYEHTISKILKETNI